jgi:exodeoxyribonuclease-3
MDVYKPKRWVDDALFRPEVRAAFHRLIEQGWCDALRTTHPERGDLHLLGLFPQCVRA